MIDDTPISIVEGLDLLTQALRRPFDRGVASTLLLAVSGGPDSIAMLWLVAGARALIGADIHVATVDHGLRDAAAFEASSVARTCKGLGLQHRTLRWEGDKPRSNRQGAARLARYRLLEDLACDIGAGAILTAHHEDDQFETHRLARERHAGDRGLAGMRTRRAMAPAVDLVRPFLGLPRARMRRTAEASRLPFFDDPSNDDTRYGRVRLRRDLKDLGEDARSELRAAIARHREAVERADAAIAEQLDGEGRATVDGFGRLRWPAKRLRALPPELRSDALARILVAIGGAEHPPLRDAIDRMAERLIVTNFSRGPQALTLGGVRASPGETLVFAREYGRIGPSPVAIGDRRTGLRFDGRFRVSIDEAVRVEGRGDARLVPLGSLGRGNDVERTMPILLGADGVPLAIPGLLAHKLPGVVGRLHFACRAGWRLRADLPRVETA